MPRVDKPLDLLEFETMLLGRHMHMLNPRGRGMSEERLDRSAYVLLSRIQVEGPMSIGGLREAFGLDASTLNRQTAAMLRAGVVERMPDPEGASPASSPSPPRAGAGWTPIAPRTWTVWRRS